jgi:hypothetical protein
MKSFKRCISLLITLSLLISGTVHAAPALLIGTEQMAAVERSEVGNTTRANLQAYLQRDDLAGALRERGVSVEQLRDRVDALTDAEAAQMLAQIDSAPAGGDILGVIFTVFVILLVTDILGLTKVFPFTRSVR